MNFEDERYVRLYVRDTVTWKLLKWQGKCLLPLLLRKVDRAGCADLDGAGIEGVAALAEIPLEVVEPGFQQLLERGVVEVRGDVLIFPKFLAAQEARQSERLCYEGVITAEDERHFAVRKEQSSITAVMFYRSDLKQCDNARRYLKAVQS